MNWRCGLMAAILTFGVSASAAAQDDQNYIETPSLLARVESGALPPVAERLPATPLLVTLEGELQPGEHGGQIRTLITRTRDTRLMAVYGYARLVGYGPDLALTPDVLRAVDVEESRIFTLHLRPGHRWSDGAPFTAEDFRYWWEDVANNAALSPAGPPAELLVQGAPPQFEVLDDTTVRYTWAAPNPGFLDSLARARPVYIYAPAHYLKQFHESYGDAAMIAAAVTANNVSGWAQLHNRFDNLYNMDNMDLPTLQPWVNTTPGSTSRFVFARNPFFHRVDQNGRQLPYADEVAQTVADGRLVPAMANSGEADLQSRGLNFSDVTVLRGGEERSGYQTYLWPDGKAAHFALYPNLNHNDPVWRNLFRDVRFRRALSAATDRRIINQSLFFGLAAEGNATLQPLSPLYRESYFRQYATYSPDAANRLLDEIGLTDRGPNNVRLLPDGRPLEIIVENAGEDPQQIDLLELLSETWSEVGVRLLIRSTSREVMRNRTYAGEAHVTVWSGWDNGVATPAMSPGNLAPTRQDTLNWPKWGQYYQTGGEAGEPIDMPEAQALMDLYDQWLSSNSDAQREQIWLDMLAIHAEQQFIIGIVSSVLQPIVVSNHLHNVPEQGVYSWDPGGHFGMYRPDQFWLDASRR